MCTTLQYIRLCPHPATHRFRDSVCKNPSGPTCRVVDHEVMLPILCDKCAKGRIQAGREKKREESRELVGVKHGFDDIWHVPARCFIDVGFSNLDPFRTAPEKAATVQQADFHSWRSSSSWLSDGESETETESERESGSERESESEGDDDSADEMMCPRAGWPVGLCCMQQRCIGYYAATRLESWDDRFEGKIWDNRCSSQR